MIKESEKIRQTEEQPAKGKRREHSRRGEEKEQSSAVINKRARECTCTDATVQKWGAGGRKDEESQWRSQKDAEQDFHGKGPSVGISTIVQYSVLLCKISSTFKWCGSSSDDGLSSRLARVAILQDYSTDAGDLLSACCSQACIYPHIYMHVR